MRSISWRRNVRSPSTRILLMCSDIHSDITRDWKAAQTTTYDVSTQVDDSVAELLVASMICLFSSETLS